MQTDKTYRSAIDAKIVVPISVILLLVILPMIINRIWSGLFFILLVVVFIIYLFSTTKYTITGTTLKINAGFIVNISVDIMTIKTIAETDSIFSAPANSLDRIEVAYNKYDSVVISPINKAGFIADILAINRGVTVTYKK